MNRRSETTTKVFVGSLPTGVTTDDLRALFAPYGTIAECDISNRCGFLHLEDNELAMKAISELNGTDFMGGRISVEKGRVKPRRGPGGGGGGGGGGPMRGGKDRGGPYARNDFRGPPRNGGGGFGGGRDFSPYGGGGDRFGGYDRPQRGGYDGGYGERRPPFDDRRAGGFGGERRPFSSDFDRRSYGDARAAGFADVPRSEFDDRRAVGEFDDRRPLLGDRRPLLDQQGPPPRGPGSFDRGAPVAELYSRRDQMPKALGAAGGFADRGGYGTGSSNGYTGGYGTTAAVAAGGYGSPAGAAAGGYGTGGGSFGGAAQASGYSDTRGYGTAAGGYGNPGGYGDSYGAGAGGRGSYDAAYPPLPQQRGGFASGGGPGPRRDMAPGGRF